MPASIRSRLFLLVLSVIVPAAAALLWQIARTYDAERQAHERVLRETSRALSMVVDRELNQRAAIVRVLALSRSLDQAPGVSNEELQSFDQQARRALQGLDGWIEVASNDATLLDTRQPAGTRPPPSDRPAALSDSPFIGPLEADPDDASMSAAIVQPVKRDGHTLLNLRLTILPAELQRILDAQRLPADWLAAVLDNRGNVVARHPGGAAYVGRTAAPALKAELANRLEGVFEAASLDGLPVMGYFDTSPQGWTYVAAMPQAQLGGNVPRAVLQVAVGALLLLGAAMAGVLWVSRRIVAPVISLKENAARLQSGEPLDVQPTGMAECDEVLAVLAQASEAMRDARTDLERQVAEAVARTREAEQRASQSQRVEALGRLTGGVAHDFNNLLGVISNSAHVIERQSGDDRLAAPLAAVLRAVDVGSRLTQHLLRFAGRQPVRPQTLHLGRYLPELDELLKTVLGSRIQVSISVALATRPITVDSSELELALINLALNARDVLPAGGQVWLQARNAQPDDIEGLPPRAYVLILFNDSGRGIDDALAARAFEPFFTTKPSGKGTGLGLSQVHGFCTQAGGTARLASTAGLGTTITLVLPASDADASSPPPPVAALEPLQRALRGKRLLLVEDNEELAAVTAALLTSYGLVVTHASGPEAALKRLHEGLPCDVVLSDVLMPGSIDGIALGRTIRGRWPELPVVLVSGYSATLATVDSEFEVLHKPTPPDALLAALQRAIEAASGISPAD